MDGSDDDDDDLEDVTVIVTSLAGVIATAILVSVCAVLVCRVQRHVGWVQRWPLSKPQTAAGHAMTDHGYVSIEISHSTPSQVNPTATPRTFTTELDHGVGDYCEITTASVCSVHSNHDEYVPSSPETRSRTSTHGHDTENVKNPYAILERNRRNIQGFYNIVGKPQDPEPSKLDWVVSSTQTSDINSSSLGPNDSKLENGEDCNIAVALVGSEESLTRCSNSNVHPSNKPNQLYNTLDSVGGAYSHLKPIGAQMKVIANVYNG